MEDEIVIFTKFIQREGEEDSYFISLTSDADTQLSAVSVSSIRIRNVLSSGTPIISMSFIDSHGDLVNANRLDTEKNYYLYFGKNVEQSSRLPIKISRIDFENSNAGNSESYVFNVFFVMSNWPELIQKTYNRGWSNIKYSDVVSQIASESGFDDIDVSTTKTTRETVIQPHWSNLGLLQNIRTRAIPQDSTGHYEFGVTLDNRFFFLSTEELVNRSIELYEPQLENDESIVPFLKMDGYLHDEQERRESTKQNANIPANFVRFNSSERFLDGVVQGAGGVESQYYDYENRTFVRESNTFSNSNEKTLSEWSLVHPSNEMSSLKIYGGRNSDFRDMAQNRVSDVMMSMNAIQISTNGSDQYQIGGVIELLIPSPPDKNNLLYNEMYSGFYWLIEVEHIFNLKDGEFKSNLTISRNGIDGKDLEGYVPSSGGRIV